MAFYSDKYDIFLGSTRSFCQECKDTSKLVEAHIVSKDNDVFLRKFCPQCGESTTLISSDLEYYKLCEDYLKKPDLPEFFTSQIKHGCPFDCGVCPQHQNHPCLALFNITDECNMKCNICYFSSHPGAGNHRSMEQIERMLETLLKVESAPDLIQVTGGEPTTHPQILDILRYLKKSPVRHLMLNTNGIRVSQDEDFVSALKSLGAGFEVYLQFDSLDSDALKKIRSADMRDIRIKALEMLEKYNISTTLVCVIARDINDVEIPNIIDFALNYRCVRGVVFQPIQFAGRSDIKSDDVRITLSDIRKLVIDDCGNPFEAQDMIPLPCDPHKICVGYAAKRMDGDKASVFPVTGKIPKSVITKHSGTIAFEQDREFVKGVIETVSLDTAMGENILKDKIKQKLFCCWPSFFSPSDMGYENVFRIVIMEFSDVFNFDTTNIKRECNFMIEPDAAIPFSAYNMGIKATN